MVRVAFEYLFGRGANALAPGLCGPAGPIPRKGDRGHGDDRGVLGVHGGRDLVGCALGVDKGGAVAFVFAGYLSPAARPPFPQGLLHGHRTRWAVT